MDEVERQLQELENQLQVERAKSTQIQRDYIHQNMAGDSPLNSNLIQYQLDMRPEIEDIMHLIKNEVIKVDPYTKQEYWAESDDIESRTVSKEGAHTIMSILQFIVNKHIILSAYKEEEVDLKMIQLKEEIADEIFNRYEVIFYKPSIEEIMHRDIKLIQYYGQKLDDLRKIEVTEINRNMIQRYESLLKEKIRSLHSKTDVQYEDEGEKIYYANLKRSPLLVMLICESINAAYNKAIGGADRNTARKAHFITENINTMPRGQTNSQQQQGFNILKPSTWSR